MKKQWHSCYSVAFVLISVIAFVCPFVAGAMTIEEYQNAIEQPHTVSENWIKLHTSLIKHVNQSSDKSEKEKALVFYSQKIQDSHGIECGIFSAYAAKLESDPAKGIEHCQKALTLFNEPIENFLLPVRNSLYYTMGEKNYILYCKTNRKQRKYYEAAINAAKKYLDICVSDENCQDVLIYKAYMLCASIVEIPKEKLEFHLAYLKYLKEKHGEQSPKYCFQCERIANVYRDCGDVDMASLYMQKSLNVQGREGEPAPKALALLRAADFFLSLDQYEEAQKYIDSALELRLKSAVVKTSSTVKWYDQKAKIFLKQKKYDVAYRCLSEGDEFLKKLGRKEEKHSYLKLKDNEARAQHLLSWENYYRSLSKFEECLMCLKKIEELRRDTPQCVSSIVFYKKLADLYAESGKYEEAEIAFKKAFLSCQRNGREESISAAELYHAYAEFQYVLGNYAVAEKYALDELLIQKRIYGEIHSSVAFCSLALGKYAKTMGNYPKAEKYYQKSLDILKKIYGENHHNTVFPLNNLANVYGDFGNYSEAIRINLNTYSILQEYGDTNSNTCATVLNNLGKHYFLYGDYENAEKYSLMALSLWEKIYGDCHIKLCYALNNLSEIYRDKGDYEKSGKMARKSLEIVQKTVGEEHEKASRAYLILGKYFLAAKDFEAAKRALLQSLEISKKIFSSDHPLMVQIQTKLVEVNILQKDFEHAFNLIEDAKRMNENLFGKLHPGTADLLQLKGDILFYQKKYADALNSYLTALSIYTEKLNSSHIKLKQLYCKIADTYKESGDLPQAQRYYQKSNTDSESTGKSLTVSLDALWAESRASGNAEQALKKYYELLKKSLDNQDREAVAATIRDMLHLNAQSNSVESELLSCFDSLEDGIRTGKELPEYFLFLDEVTSSGFSDAFAEQRKNYFGNLEDKIEEFENSDAAKLTALTLLATNYLRDTTFFADGKSSSVSALLLAEEQKNSEAALQLYQMTLRQLIHFSDTDFLKLYPQAEKMAQKEKREDFLASFQIQKILYEFKVDKKENFSTAESIAQRFPDKAAKELIAFLATNQVFLNSGSPECLKLIKLIPSSAIGDVKQSLRRQIAFTLENAHEPVIASLWFGGQCTLIDRLLYLNAASINDSPDAVQKNVAALAQISPEAFKMEGINYSKEDMDLLLSVTKCKYAKLLADDAALFDAAKHAENLILSGKCDKSFIKILQSEIDTTLCDFYYLNGDFDSAMEKITSLLEGCSETDIRYPAYLMQGGLCSLAKQENKDAQKKFDTAAHLFEAHNKNLRAASAYRHLACALYRLGEYQAALEAIRKCGEYGTDTANNGMHLNQAELDSGLLIELALIKNDKTQTRSQKTTNFQMLQNRFANVESPLVRCDFLLASAEFQTAIIRHPDLPGLIRNLEDYFKYKDAIATEEWFRTPSFLPDGEEKARKMLFSALRKQNDVAKLDYWNKKFEQHRVRSMSVAKNDTDNEEEENVSDLALLDLIEQFQTAKAIVEEELRKPEGERDKKLLQSATSTRRRLETLFEMKKRQLSKEKQAKFTALATDTFVIPADALSQLASALEPGTVCLQFIPMDDEILVYLVAHNAPPVLQTISLKKHTLTGAKFQNQLQKLRVLLQSNSSPETKVKKELKKVYDILIADLIPALDKLGTKKLLVNSMGVLRYIPFAALYDGKQYLVEKYQITNATGLDMVRLSKAAASREMDKVKAVVFANPDGSLPSAQKEGENVASLFQKKQVFVGPQATIGELEALAGNVNFLHLATHGVIDAEHPRKSFIMLANGTKWRYCDMMGFNIENVDSIVLSACNSAVSEKATGGEIEGMAYQLLRKSPSGSVLASLWKVDDKATSVLMDVYYKHMTDSIAKQHSLDRGGALREAQLKLLKNNETAKPYYWAAFTLFGDCR